MIRKNICAAVVLAFAAAPPAGIAADITPLIQQQMPSLAPMIERVLPAVVNIQATGRAQGQNPLADDPFFRYFFDMPGRPRQQEESQSIGSGVIVDATRGYVLTNNHVVENTENIKVFLEDGRSVEAKVIGNDPDSDLAVVQIKAANLKALPLADSEKLLVGDYVVAIGNPFGIGQTVTSGIVSALGRGGLGNRYENFIQTDASINPGNSGGALVNLRGELVGIPSNILSRTGGNIGIGFAIPSNLARAVMTQIVETGTVQRGRIGVVMQDLTPELAKAFGLETTRGVIVAQVAPNSPAAKAGVLPEDIIVEANGKTIRDMAQMRNQIGLLRVGDKVDLRILREGKPRNLTVTVGKDAEQVAAGGKLHPRLAGASFGPLDDGHPLVGQVSGIVVQQVQPGSPAARLGLRSGDIIQSVNRRPVKDMEEFSKLAGAGAGELLLHLRRGNTALFVLVQ